MSALIKSHPLGIDVYFPVEEHRKLILQQPNHQFLIMYVNGYEDDQVERQFSAWDSEGKKITLTSKKPPATPVLVITQCEHHGQCRLGTNSDTFGKTSSTENHSLQKPCVSVYFKLQWCEIFDDKEPWTKGAAEIYFTTWLYAGGYQVGYYRKDLTNVDYEGEYTFDPPVILVTSSNGGTSAAKIEVWEEDSGDPNDWLERWGGWNLEHDTGPWYLYNLVNDFWQEWHGDDDCCDIITRGEWYY